jgi:hypothetical protein
MCPKHPETILQSICDEDGCPKCYEEWILAQPLPKKWITTIIDYVYEPAVHRKIMRVRERTKDDSRI